MISYVYLLSVVYNSGSLATATLVIPHGVHLGSNDYWLGMDTLEFNRIYCIINNDGIISNAKRPIDEVLNLLGVLPLPDLLDSIS